MTVISEPRGESTIKSDVFGSPSNGPAAVTLALRILLTTLLIIIGALGGDSHAQSFFIQTYGEGDGLPSATVNDIIQDDSGRLWFATRFGVAVYDSWEWKIYDMNDGLPTADQRRLLYDHLGRVWAVGGLCATAVFENGSWTALPIFTAAYADIAPPAAVAPRQDGTLLMIAPPKGGVHYFAGEEWAILPLPDDSGRVHALVADDSLVYLGCDSGVLTVDPERPELGARFLNSAPRTAVFGLHVDRSADLFCIAGADFVGRIHGGEFEMVTRHEGFELEEAYDFLVCEPDLIGGLYVGNPLMLYRCDEFGCERITPSTGLSTPGATSLLLDREGNMWVTSLRGVSKIVSTRFSNFTDEHGLEADEVTAVLERRDGSVILGHPAGFTFFGDTLSTHSLPRTMGSRVLDLTEDSRGIVWAAVNTYGLASIDLDGNIEWQNSDLFRERITSVLVDRSDQLWVTTAAGVFRQEEDGFEQYPRGFDWLPRTSYVRRIFEGRDGKIYLASASGLFSIWQGEIEFLSSRQTRDADNIYAFYQEENGTIWTGTRDGLYRDDGQGLTKVLPPGPQIDRPVYFIVADQHDRLWFGIDNGVVRWDGAQQTHMKMEDGLVGRETNRAAGMVDSRGRVWIGMDRGLSIYDEKFDVSRRVPPLVELSGVDVNGRMLSLDDDLKLDHWNNTLVFHFRAMSFTDEQNVTFRGRLEGFDDAWLDLLNAPDRHVRYTNVPAGKYTFHLQAASASGAWSETVSSSVITIDAPFWQKPQFIIALIVLIALAVFVGVGFVSQRRYARRLEREVRSGIEERRSIEGELEKARRIETLGVLAGGIAHDFNNLLTIMMSNFSYVKGGERPQEDVESCINDAMSAARRARSLTEQLLTFSRGGAPVRQPGSVADVIKESASFVMSGSSIRCEMDLPADLWVVDIDAGQMSQVVNNLLLNAKEAMSDGGFVRVRGRNHSIPPVLGLEPGRYVEITIEDEGDGITFENLDRVFDPYFTTKSGGNGLGLTTAYSIVKRHDGLLGIESPPGSGTTCRIYLPASRHAAVTSTVTDQDPGTVTGRILLMDDEKGIRRAAVKVLNLFGHIVELANDGAEAVSVYKKHLVEGNPFDLVIMDLTIPGGMGGKEALEKLKEIDPGVRAIVASGYSNDPVLADFKSHGFCGRITKPYSASDLLRAVGHALAGAPDDTTPI